MPAEYKNFSPTEKLEALYKAGHVEVNDKTRWPVMVRYLGERDGVPIQDIWTYQPYTQGTVWETSEGIDEDVKWLGPTDPERIGFQTQKPLGLMERIINAFSDRDDWVLDPFGGCGTTAAAAEKLRRNWNIIDITTLSINLVKRRIEQMYKNKKITMTVEGYPADLAGAKELFGDDPFEFQYWCCDLINARPYADKKKGADRGIDGTVVFPDREENGDQTVYRKLLVQVKGGKVSSAQIRDFRGTIDREKAAGGIFVSLEPPTNPMKKEAIEAGEYQYYLTGQEYPVIQIFTAEELLEGKKPNHPSSISYVKEAEVVEDSSQLEML